MIEMALLNASNYPNHFGLLITNSTPSTLSFRANISTCEEIYGRTLCNFGVFLQNLSVFFNLVIFLPQFFKTYRKKSSYIAGISIIWFILAASAALADVRYLIIEKLRFNAVMDVWLFISSSTMSMLILYYTESRHTFFKPLFIASLVFWFSLIVVISVLSEKSAKSFHWFGSLMSYLQIYPQLLLNVLLKTSQAVSAWTIVLLVVKWSCYYVSLYIMLADSRDFIFSYLTAIMFLFALLQHYSFPEREISQITRTQFATLPKEVDSIRNPPNGHIQRDLDLFSIDDYEIEPSVYQPTVSVREDRGRKAMVCLSWYGTMISICIICLLMTIGFLWKLRSLSAIFSVLSIAIAIGLTYCVKYLPPNIANILKLLL